MPSYYDLITDRRLVANAFRVLELLPAEVSKGARRKKVLSEAIAGSRATRKDADLAANIIVEKYNDFSLVRERLSAAYARDLKTDSFGKCDERKFQTSVQKIIKQEGLNGEYIYYDHPHLLGWFSAEDVKRREVKLNTPYDRGMNYEADVVAALSGVSPDAAKTVSGADFGVDVIFTYRGRKFAGQCKALAKAAGVPAIREIVTGARHYAADHAVVFSLNGFSDAALELATTNKVICLVGTDLSSLDRQLAVFS